MLPEVRLLKDREQWDSIVQTFPNASFLQSSAWADLKSKYGWTTKRFVIGDKDSIRGGVQVLVRTRRVSHLGPSMGIAYVPRGPLAPETVDARALVHAIVEEARQAGSSFLRVEPTSEAHARILVDEGFVSSSRFIQIPRTGVVELGQNPDELLKSFKSKMRYNIRLAVRRGVVVDAQQNEDAFRDFYELTKITASREQFAVHHPSYYREVCRCFGQDAGLFVARHNGSPLAAVIAVAYGHTAVYLYGASSNIKRNLMAPHAVQWAAMQWAQTRGCRFYDLWGMSDPEDSEDPMAGVHRFKLGFEPQLKRYPGAYDRSIQNIRGRILRSGVLEFRSAINRWRGRGTSLSV